MFKKEDFLKKAVLYLFLLICITFIYFEFDNYNESVQVMDLYSVNSEINKIDLKISSDDLISLNSNNGNMFWRSVKMKKDSDYTIIDIRNSKDENAPFEIRIDDEVYKLYKINETNIKKFAFVQVSKLSNIKSSDLEIKELFFNEVDMGTYIVEKKVYELVRNDEIGYFVSLNSETEYIRNLRYTVDNEMQSSLDFFNTKTLSKYIVIHKMFNGKDNYDFNNLYFLHNSDDNKLEPYICMDNVSYKLNDASINLSKLINSSNEYKNMIVKVVEDDNYLNNIIELQQKIYKQFDEYIKDDDLKNRELLIKRADEIRKGIDTNQNSLTGTRVKYAVDGKWKYLKLSHKSGFYEDGFELSFDYDKNYRLYYTLDGSEPTTNSTLYTKPIKMNDRSSEEDVLSKISTTSVEWKKPLTKSFKAAVIRFRVFENETPVSDIITNSYFIAPNMKNKYSFPIISLVTDRDNLFSYDKGIYVLGKSRAWWKSRNRGAKPGRGSFANYTRRGREWERPVHIEWFEPDGTEGFSLNMGTRINGGWSRSYPMKPLRFYARKEYDEKNIINYEMFPGLKKENSDESINTFKRFLLRNSGHDVVLTMFEDAMTHSLMEDIKLDVQAYRPVILFINGEYWGIHNLRERQDEYYIASHYDMNPEEFVILENRYATLHGQPNDKKHFLDILNYIKSHDIRQKEVYDNIKTKIDIDNFINYYALEIYLVNLDWPGNNSKLWRKNTETYEPNSPYGYDGRWRWLLYDTEGGFKYYRYNMIEYMTVEGQKTGLNAEWATFLFRSLLKNDEFRNAFLARTADMLNTNLRPEHVIERIDEYQKLVKPEIQEHINRWNTCGKSMEGWLKNVNVLKEFAANRPKFLFKNFCNHFNINGSCKIKYRINNSNGGTIKINDYEVNIKNGEFEGTYFIGVKNKVEAIPNEGFIFKGWKGSINGSEPTIYILPSDDCFLEAVFEKK